MNTNVTTAATTPVTTAATTPVTTVATAPEAMPDGFKSRMKSGNLGTNVEVETTTSTTTSSTTTGATTPVTTSATTKIRRAKGYEKAPKAKELDSEAIKDAVREGVKEGAKAATEAAAAVKAAPSGQELTPAEQKQLEVLTAMEESNPEKYKGITGKAKEFIAKFDDFKDGWAKDNPEGTEAEFEAATEKFRQKMGVTWDEGDFDDAKVNLLVEAKVKERVDQQVKPLQDKAAEAEIRPKVGQAALGAMVSVAAEIGGDFAKVIKADGSFDEAALNEVVKADPIAAQVYVNATQVANQFAGDTVLTFHGRPPSPEAAREINTIVKEYEQRFSALPEGQQLNDKGQRFTTHGAFKRMSAAERDKHWVLTPTEVIEVFNADMAKDAKVQADQARQEFEQNATRMGFKRETTAVTTVATEAPAPTATKKKPDSPESISGSPSETAGRAGQVQASGGFMERMKRGTKSYG